MGASFCRWNHLKIGSGYSYSVDIVKYFFRMVTLMEN